MSEISPAPEVLPVAIAAVRQGVTVDIIRLVAKDATIPGAGQLPAIPVAFLAACDAMSTAQ